MQQQAFDVKGNALLIVPLHVSLISHMTHFPSPLSYLFHALRPGLLLLIIASLSLSQLAFSTPPEDDTKSSTEKPNIVLITADDLFVDIGCYGNDRIQTPNLDRLAERGVVFEHAYANYPLCGPSRNSLMSGRYAEDTGLNGLRELLREQHPEMVTLSQHFMNNGYTAARVGKIYHAENPDGIGLAEHDDPESWDIALNPIGRDVVIEKRIIRISDQREGVEHVNGLGAQLSWYADPIGKDTEHTDGLVATESIRLMERFVAEKQPFFLGVGFYKPHTPFVAPKHYFDMYQVEDMPLQELPKNYLSTLPEPAVDTIRCAKPWMPGQIDIPEPLAREVVRAYYATSSFLDANVGRVLDAIDRLGIADNTIIVFLSDHGFHVSEHGHWQKHTLFEQADQIPMIIVTPKSMSAGKRTAAMVEIVDLYRTLSELAGLPEPCWTAGESFAQVLEQPESSARECIVSAIDHGKGRHFTVRTQHWRYTRWQDGGEGMIELYDLSQDPEELHNIASEDDMQPVIEKMDALLDKRLAAMRSTPTDAPASPE